MKPRRNTADSDTELQSSSRRPSASSVEMNAWPRRYTPQAPKLSGPQLAPLDFGHQQQQQPPPPSHPKAPHQQPQRSPLSPRTQFYNQLQQYQLSQREPPLASPSPGSYQPGPRHRTSATSAHDGATRGSSQRGSAHTPRLPPLMTVDYNGESVFFPLSPAPIKKHDSTATSRLVLCDDSSDVLPPDECHLPVVGRGGGGGGARDCNLPAPVPGISVPPPAATTAPGTHVRIIHASQPGPPSIYWSDDGTSQAGTDATTIRSPTITTNPSAFTFYREDPDDDSDGDGDPRRSNRGSRRFSRLSRLSKTTTSSAPRDQEKRRSSLYAPTGRGVPRRGSAANSNNDKGEKAAHKETGGASGGGRRVSLCSDDELEDGVDANGLRLEGRHTAEFEFVNGRYVPPALRNGRAPGRKPVNEVRELERELERKRRQKQSGRYLGRRTRIDAELGGDDDDEEEHGLRIKRGSPSFWWIVGLALFFVIAIAVGVGAGVGLSTHKR